MKKSQNKFSGDTTIDVADVQSFDALGEKWWDESGPMKPLHRLNPVRLSYLRDTVCAHFGKSPQRLRALGGLTVADIGCGGGLVTEPLARMGADVTGIDAGQENIRVAKAHAKKFGLKIDYKASSVEKLAQSGAVYDVVTALEIVEHVADVETFLCACAALVKPGGVLIVSTLNRTPKSFLLGIAMAEYVLRWLPPGTHNWRKFLKPSEVARHLTPHGMTITDVTGMVYSPLTRAFSLSADDLDVNYFLSAAKAKK